MALNLAKRAAHLNLAYGPPALPPLIFMTDRRRVESPVEVAAALPRGSAVILRNYDDPQRASLAWALRAVCRRSGVRLLIGADTGLALTVGADGVHYPEYLLLRSGRVRRPKPGWLVTAAAHSTPALVRARRACVDAAILGSVFETGSHPGRAGLGPHRFAALARSVDLPVYALGGVSETTAPRLVKSGAAGIAAVTALASIRESPRRAQKKRADRSPLSIHTIRN